GIRRIEAVTGPVAVERYQQAYEILDRLSKTFKTGWQDLPSQIDRLQLALRNASAQVESPKLKLASQSLASTVDQARTVNGVKVFAQTVEDLDRSGMRQLAD